jgi:hypothetical protein
LLKVISFLHDKEVDRLVAQNNTTEMPEHDIIDLTDDLHNECRLRQEGPSSAPIEHDTTPIGIDISVDMIDLEAEEEEDDDDNDDDDDEISGDRNNNHNRTITDYQFDSQEFELALTLHKQSSEKSTISNKNSLSKPWPHNAESTSGTIQHRMTNSDGNQTPQTPDHPLAACEPINQFLEEATKRPKHIFQEETSIPAIRTHSRERVETQQPIRDDCHEEKSPGTRFQINPATRPSESSSLPNESACHQETKAQSTDTTVAGEQSSRMSPLVITVDDSSDDDDDDEHEEEDGSKNKCRLQEEEGTSLQIEHDTTPIGVDISVDMIDLDEEEDDDDEDDSSNKTGHGRITENQCDSHDFRLARTEHKSEKCTACNRNSLPPKTSTPAAEGRSGKLLPNSFRDGVTSFSSLDPLLECKSHQWEEDQRRPNNNLRKNPTTPLKRTQREELAPSVKPSDDWHAGNPVTRFKRHRTTEPPESSWQGEQKRIEELSLKTLQTKVADSDQLNASKMSHSIAPEKKQQCEQLDVAGIAAHTRRDEGIVNLRQKSKAPSAGAVTGKESSNKSPLVITVDDSSDEDDSGNNEAKKLVEKTADGLKGRILKNTEEKIKDLDQLNVAPTSGSAPEKKQQFEQEDVAGIGAHKLDQTGNGIPNSHQETNTPSTYTVKAEQSSKSPLHIKVDSSGEDGSKNDGKNQGEELSDGLKGLIVKSTKGKRKDLDQLNVAKTACRAVEKNYQREQPDVTSTMAHELNEIGHAIATSCQETIAPSTNAVACEQSSKSPLVITVYDSSDDEDANKKDCLQYSSAKNSAASVARPTKFKPIKRQSRAKRSIFTTQTIGENLETERRYVFRQASSSRPPSKPESAQPFRLPTFNSAREYSYQISHEDALRQQEELLQASAARVRAQAHIRLATPGECEKPVTFDLPVFDVATRYPNHWQFTDHSARLGLPRGAPLHSVKSQYRKLALIYHPDKSKGQHAAVKFQAIIEAYRALAGR